MNRSATEQIHAERAAMEHVAAGVDRYTTLPTSELLKDIDVLRIEESLTGNLDAVYKPLLGAVRAARLLGKDEVAEALRNALKAVTDIQAELARERGQE